MFFLVMVILLQILREEFVQFAAQTMQGQTHYAVEITIDAGYQGASGSLYAIGACLVTACEKVIE